MIRARKRFGQHFLEPAWQRRVIDACRVGPDDDVVEIGPGTGALTTALVERARRVLAIEVDRDLAAALVARRQPRLTLHVGDVLAPDVGAVLASWLGTDPCSPFRVVGNLPYNVSTPILFMLARWRATRPGLVDATVMLQAEVADRLVAAPGSKEYGVLTLLTSMAADVTRLVDLPPGAFRPAPRVHSSLVRLTFSPPPPYLHHPALVDRLIRTVFTQRRKTLVNGLKALAAGDGVALGAVTTRAGLDGRRRPETLQLLEFSALADAWTIESGRSAVI